MRRIQVLLGLALALSCVGATAASAHAIVTTADLPSRGVPTHVSTVRSAPTAHVSTVRSGPTAHAAAAAIAYEGGSVLRSNRTHVVFWQPSGSGLTFDPGYIPLVEQFLADVAADSHSTTNEYGITGEYTDAGGPAAYASSYGGAVIDTDPMPASACVEPILTGPGWATCLTDAQLQSELLRVIAANHLPTGPTDVYFLLTPNGFGSCTDSASSSCALGGSASGYCGYHSATSGGVLYAVIPYNAVSGHCQSGNPRPNASTADPTLSTLSHEHAEIVTDPFGDAWVGNDGSEIADLCITDFGAAIGGSGSGAWNEAIDGHHYWLQELYSRIAGACEPRPQSDTVSFDVQASGRTLHFAAHARVPGGFVASYSWSFGDTRHGRGRQTDHVYAKSGNYRITLRITDSAGNWAYATRSVTITPGSARDRTRRHRRARSQAARSAGSARTTTR